MPRRNPNAPTDGQPALFDPPTTKDSQRLSGGRHTNAVARTLKAAYDREHFEDLDEALATTLLHGAWGMDSMEAQNKPYGPSKLVPAMVEALREANLTPDSRNDDTDESIAELVKSLATAEDDEDTIAQAGWADQ